MKGIVPKSLWVLGIGVAAAMLNVSCADDYPYDDSEPTFVNSNVYDFLKEDGRFSTYVRLIDDSRDLPEILRRTGTKTLFPATDEAFARFFEDNLFGVHRYEDLTPAQKRLLLGASMINMTYLSGTLSNMPNLGDGTVAEGMAVRRSCSLDVLDSIPSVTVTNTPNQYWAAHAGHTIYMLSGSTPAEMVHFTDRLADIKGITEEDLQLIMGEKYSRGGLYVNNTSVGQKDIVCKNGYVHVVNDVMMPAKNMDDIIAANADASEFYDILSRFSRPQYDDEVSKSVHLRYTGAEEGYPSITDSVFYKRYFTEARPFEDMREAGEAEAPTMEKYGLLYFDPADNSYSSMGDFGVMFVPVNEAMRRYFDEGKFLKDAYGTWENVPSYIASLFVKNHQKKSFMSSLPHTWPTMTDESSFEMGVKKEDIVSTVIGGNGVVYFTNKVYPPVDYQCVYASTLNSPVTKIANWALQDDAMKFRLYLRSMENMYNLIVPTDEAFKNYRDPLSWARGRGEIWDFEMDEQTGQPYALRYEADAGGGKGAFLGEQRNMAVVRNRLADIFDSSIVVGEKSKDGTMSGYLDEETPKYVQTKGGSTLYVNGAGDDILFAGGGDLASGKVAGLARNEAGEVLRYEAENGRTYFVNSLLHDAVQSVYQALESRPEYSSFFRLLQGDEVVSQSIENGMDVKLTDIFSTKKSTSSSGLGQVVNSFNNFQYTVFVPTNEAIAAAFAADPELKTWDEIRALCTAGKLQEAYAYAEKLLNMLRYHFMDNSVYIGGEPVSNQQYQTAARESGSTKFVRMTISSDANGLTITDRRNQTAKVVKSGNAYNLMTRDMIVNSGDYASATQIVSSSRAVIHLIDKVLRPE